MKPGKVCKLSMVIIMKNNKELLSSVLKTTQMGQVGIRSVLDTTMRPGLRKALESQLRESLPLGRRLWLQIGPILF